MLIDKGDQLNLSTHDINSIFDFNSPGYCLKVGGSKDGNMDRL